MNTFDEIASILNNSRSALLALQTFLIADTTIADTAITIAAECGLEENQFSVIQLAVHDTEVIFKEIVEIVGEAEDALDCERINGIFVALSHDALCGSASTTLLWIFWTMSIVLVLGMLIILLRGSLLPPLPNSEPYENSVHSYDQEGARVGPSLLRIQDIE